MSHVHRSLFIINVGYAAVTRVKCHLVGQTRQRVTSTETSERTTGNIDDSGQPQNVAMDGRVCRM